MLKFNIKNAFRRLWRLKFYSIVNIIGLALGLAASFFLLLYVLNETGYNNCHINRHNIYRLIENDIEVKIQQPQVPFPIANLLKDKFPEIKKTARTDKIWGVSIKKGEELISVEQTNAVDPSIFDIFTIPLVNGNQNSFLQSSNSVVISENLSKKIFGKENPLGKEIQLLMEGNDEIYHLKVEGIFKDIPRKSTFKASILCHIDMGWERAKHFYKEKEIFYGLKNSNVTTYVLMPNGYDISLLEKKMPAFIKSNITKKDVEYSFQALTDIYFSSRDLANTNAWGDLNKIKIFGAIALLILIIACVNYILLSISLSSTRFREIGIRKVLGASPNGLLRQVLTESILVSIFAVPFALLFLELSFPYMKSLLNTNLEIDYLTNWKFIIGIVIITIVVGLISGIYLAFFLSNLNPISILSGNSNSQTFNKYFKFSLIVFQIVVFVVLLNVVQVVSRQINYATTRDLGFEKDNIIKIYIDRKVNSQIRSFIEEIKNNPNIINVTYASSIPPDFNSSRIRRKHYSDPEQIVTAELISCDFDFVETMGIEMIQGRNFNRKNDGDFSKSILISESSIKAFGFLDSPIGKRIIKNDTSSYEVIGVFKDIITHSFKQKSMPIFIQLGKEDMYWVGVKYRIGSYEETNDILKEKFQKLIPNQSYNAISTTRILKDFYLKESTLKLILNISLVLAIFISMLGLFALSLFMIKQKAKDISIRKVFGAITQDIVKVMIKDFLILLVIANIIAFPISYYFSNQWLSEFAYQVNFSIVPFLLSFLLSFIIVVATVTFSIVKASQVNPADSIKHQG